MVEKFIYSDIDNTDNVRNDMYDYRIYFYSLENTALNNIMNVIQNKGIVTIFDINQSVTTLYSLTELQRTHCGKKFINENKSYFSNSQIFSSYEIFKHISDTISVFNIKKPKEFIKLYYLFKVDLAVISGKYIKEKYGVCILNNNCHYLKCSTPYYYFTDNFIYLDFMCLLLKK